MVALTAQVALWHALRGLSVALDLAMGRRPGHTQAVAALGIQIGHRLGLSGAGIEDLALAALLKDAGCPSTRAPFTQVVGVDDIAFHSRIFGLERTTATAIAGLLWELQVRQAGGPRARVASWTHSLFGMKTYIRHHLGQRSAEAVRVAKELGCSPGTTAIIAAIGEAWDGSGTPRGLAGVQIPIAARILAAAQLATIWGEEAAPREVAGRLALQAGGRLDPLVVRAVRACLRMDRHDRSAVWIDALARGVWWLDPSPGGENLVSVVTLASVFGEIVDSKSPFTASHSLRVAGLAGSMAFDVGMTGEDQSAIVLAGLLHDLGKLAVPNTILDKNGPLNDHEWAIIRRHPADSARVIGELPGWETVADWVGAHHERPDGQGYHRGLRGEAIPPAANLLAVADAFDAMTADRPYQRGLPVAEALRRVRAGRGTQFDPLAAEILEGVVGTRIVGVPLGSDQIELHLQ